MPDHCGGGRALLTDPCALAKAALPPDRCARDHACVRPKHDEPPKPPVMQACDICPPCAAPCSVAAPPTPAEKEVARLTVRLQQVQDSFKTKITECALLRADATKGRAEAEREKAATRTTVARLRELEGRFDALSEYTHALLRNKEQTLHQDEAARALRLCYHEARDELAELRTLLDEQALQLQDYRAKYQQAQQLVEEQKKQLAAQDMDNTRIADQINLEIQTIKVNFMKRLQELSPLPEQLKATQRKLQAAQTARALAEHAAANTQHELETARERVQTLLTLGTSKPPERPPERGNEEKLLAMVQQRVTQLTEMNAALKGEIERQKANVLRLEEATLVCERRLQEKMHECAALGGELDRAREEAARAVQRAERRADTVRECMEAAAVDVQQQLARSRDEELAIQREQEVIRCRMLCQVQRLEANVAQSELRVTSMQAQLAALRRRDPGDPGDPADPDDGPECLCRNHFEK